MRRFFPYLLVAGLGAYPCARLFAHVRLQHPTSGAALHWSAPASIGVVTHAGGSDDVPGRSLETALRLAIQEWNAAGGTAATLVEDLSAASRARADWEADDIHLVLFDEDDASGFFPPGSSTVALTPIWFLADGAIQDADVLLNGAGFTFTTSGAPGHFDVQDVATHELGHLLGLDHTGCASATMHPYVDQGIVLQRSLAEDEKSGLRDAYPAGSFGQITGSIARASDGSPVSGAHVVARDEHGRTRASILADTRGSFLLRGLEPGTYTVYARPLEATAGAGNLGPYWRGRIDTDFEPTLYAASATILGANTVALGTLAVGSDVALSLGAPYDTFPIRATSGASRTIVVHGTGLFVGSTLEASDPDLILGTPLWTGTQVSCTLTVPAGEERGEVDLTVTSASGRIAILPAALEIAPPAPTVSAVVPGRGSASGGDALTLTGANFASGARVVIGERIYTDGVDATVLDAGTITLTTAATASGRHDVVVIDRSGLEGRAPRAFQVRSSPGLARVLPGAGAAQGGTTVLLAGEGFEAGMTVFIAGVEQGPVTVEDATRASFTTTGGAAGGPLALELENPDGARAAFAFTYVDQADPILAAISPDEASASGGSLLTLTGSHFTPTMGVWFLAGTTGEPVPAARVDFLDASTLQVETPGHATGVVSVLVSELDGCGVFAESSFTFVGEHVSSSGGGCSISSLQGPSDPRAWVEGGWWIFTVVLCSGLRAWRGHVSRAPVRIP